jgi:DNA-binding beta-propeller fold protein YncE
VSIGAGCQLNLSYAPSGGSGFDFPLGIAFQDAYLYVANFNSNTVSVCAVNSNGTLSGCTPQTDPAISSPWGMAIH